MCWIPALDLHAIICVCWAGLLPSGVASEVSTLSQDNWMIASTASFIRGHALAWPTEQCNWLVGTEDLSVPFLIPDGTDRSFSSQEEWSKFIKRYKELHAAFRLQQLPFITTDFSYQTSFLMSRSSYRCEGWTPPLGSAAKTWTSAKGTGFAREIITRKIRATGL